MKRFKSMVAGLVSVVVVASMMPSMMVMADGISIVDCFPDEGFRSYVSEHFDTDGNGVLSDSEIQNAKVIDTRTFTSEKFFTIGHIDGIRGINYLSELTEMYFACSDLNIDLSSLHKLEDVYISTTSQNVIFAPDAPLKSIYISGNITSFSGSNYPNLESLSLYSPSLNSLDISLNTKLKELKMNTRQNDISYSLASSYPAMETLYLLQSNASFFDYRLAPNLKTLQIEDSRSKNLDFSDLRQLESLRLAVCSTETVDLTNCINLKKLEIYNCNISSIDISNNINLEYLEIDETYCLSSIDLSNNSKIKELWLGWNDLSEIDVTNLPELEVLDIDGNNISSVDLSNNSKLVRLNVSYNPNLTEINVDNLVNLETLLCIASINELNLSNNVNLEILSCKNIPVLDISNCPKLVMAYTNGVHAEGSPIYGYYENGVVYSLTIWGDNTEVIITTPTPSVTPTVQPTSRPTTPPTVNPTVAPTSNPTAAPTATPETGVGGFVERLYTIALDRPSDSVGKADWVNRVYTQGATGADVASGFLFSPEFLGKDMSTQDFLAVLYRVFFDRAGDQGGIDYWTNNMNNGMDKQTVIWGFINSTEWANVCLRYGIASGGNGVPNITIEPAPEIIAFATRLYTTCLGRPADQGGLNDWSHRLANRQISGSDAAYGFFFSSEFVNDSSIDNAEYINRLYQTFMNRPADTAGFNDWMNRMNNGASREDVFNGFAGSQEWANICSSYGILK